MTTYIAGSYAGRLQPRRLMTNQSRPAFRDYVRLSRGLFEIDWSCLLTKRRPQAKEAVLRAHKGIGTLYLIIYAVAH
jgi:hypothetical protein